mgnify:CR=1 FL=1
MIPMFSDSLRNWAEVDLDAVLHNFMAARNHLPENMRLLVTVKANGYGHGAVRIAKLLEGKADYFALAAMDEAVQLRQEMAAYLGYGSYPEFAYDFYYYRDYTPQQAQAYFETVGLSTDFNSVYEEANLLTKCYEKQKAEGFIQERTEQIIEKMDM